MTLPSGVTVRVHRLVEATPATVFNAWTDPTTHHLWACPPGASADDVHLDLRIGGDYRLAAPAAAGEADTTSGKFKVIEAPNRLVYTWERGASMEAQNILVTVEFQKVARGTEVVLRHGLFKSEVEASAIEAEWEECLDRFAARIA